MSDETIVVGSTKATIITGDETLPSTGPSPSSAEDGTVSSVTDEAGKPSKLVVAESPQDKVARLTAANKELVLTDLSSLTKSRVIGTGGYGSVYAGSYQGQKVAIKILADASGIEEMFHEASFLARVRNHPHMVHLTGVVVTPEYGLVTELMEGDLKGYLAHKEDLTYLETILVLRQVAAALGDLHEIDIMHRDVKPHNVLVNPGQTAAGVLCKICDFGVCVDASDPRVSHQRCGTPNYMASEVHMGEPNSFEADVYSFGVLAFELLTRQRPFNGERHNSFAPPGDLRLIHNDEEFPNAFKDLITSRCLSNVVSKRPTFSEVVKVIDETLAHLHHAGSAHKAQRGTRRADGTRFDVIDGVEVTIKSSIAEAHSDSERGLKAAAEAAAAAATAAAAAAATTSSSSSSSEARGGYEGGGLSFPPTTIPEYLNEAGEGFDPFPLNVPFTAMCPFAASGSYSVGPVNTPGLTGDGGGICDSFDEACQVKKTTAALRACRHPGDASNLTVLTVYLDAVRLSWTGTPVATMYQVRLCEANSGKEAVVVYAGPASATTCVVAFLEPGKSYDAKVQPFGGTIGGGWSNPIRFTLLSE